MLAECVDYADDENYGVVAQDVVSGAVAEKRHLLGFGHPLHKPVDLRAKALDKLGSGTEIISEECRVLSGALLRRAPHRTGQVDSRAGVDVDYQHAIPVGAAQTRPMDCQSGSPRRRFVTGGVTWDSSDESKSEKLSTSAVTRT